MSIDEHINVTISINNSGVSRQSFGTIGILSYKQLFPERYRPYRQPSEAIADGYASTSPEVLALQTIFSQTPRPTQAAILRGVRPPTQRYVLGFTAADTSKYQLLVKGEGVTPTTVEYISSTGTVLSQVVYEMVLDLNAVVGKNYNVAYAPLVYVDKAFTAATTDICTAVAHGLNTGDGPFQLTTSGVLPTGLSLATDYWVIKLTADTFKFATNLANAMAGIAVDISGVGSGLHNITDTVNTVTLSQPPVATASAPGNWFSFETSNPALITVLQNHTNPGVETDLNEIQLDNPDWYWLYTTFNSSAMVEAASAWVESTPFKVYVPDSPDSVLEQESSGDWGSTLTASGRKRTMPIAHRKPNNMQGAGVAGRLAPLPVGQWTVAYKTIGNTIPDKRTASQTNNLKGKRWNYYKSEAGRAIMWEGTVGSVEYGFLDVTVGLDWLLDEIQKKSFGVLVALNKLNYDDEDIALMRGTIESVFIDGASSAHRLVAKGTPGDPADPEPKVVFPRVKDIDPGVRSLRKLPNGVASFRFLGAIHTVDVQLTVTF